MGGFTFGQPDNSAAPLMWSLAQFVRLAIGISAGHLTDTPAVVADRYAASTASKGTVTQTVNVTVPVSTDASGENVYLNGNLSALGGGAPDWSPSGIPMTRVSATRWTATIHAAANTTLQYVSNRTFGFGAAGSSYTANDTVAAWGGIGGC